MYRITFYVPHNNLDDVKQALFDIGVGKIGQYDYCCWQTQGIGQFRPLDKSNPSLGQKNQVCQEPEYKVEMVCKDNLIELALKTLIQYHPYEAPAYEAYQITTLDDF